MGVLHRTKSLGCFQCGCAFRRARPCRVLFHTGSFGNLGPRKVHGQRWANSGCAMVVLAPRAFMGISVGLGVAMLQLGSGFGFARAREGKQRGRANLRRSNCKRGLAPRELIGGTVGAEKVRFFMGSVGSHTSTCRNPVGRTNWSRAHCQQAEALRFLSW